MYYLDLKELSSALDLPETQVKALLDKGELARVTRIKGPLVSSEELQRYINSGRLTNGPGRHH